MDLLWTTTFAMARLHPKIKACVCTFLNIEHLRTAPELPVVYIRSTALKMSSIERYKHIERYYHGGNKTYVRLLRETKVKLGWMLRIKVKHPPPWMGATTFRLRWCHR